MGATINIVGCVLNCLAEEAIAIAIAIATGLWGCSYGFISSAPLLSSRDLASFPSAEKNKKMEKERIFNPLLFCGSPISYSGYSGNPKKLIGKMEDAMTFLREQGMQLHVNCNACHYSTETR